MTRILKEKASIVPALRTDPLEKALPVPPRPGRIKKFITEAPHLSALKNSKFSPESILLLARFLAGSFDRAFSRVVYQFLSEDRHVLGLSARFDDMSLTPDLAECFDGMSLAPRHKDPRRASN